LKWKTKAAVQRFFARLPLGFEPVYYQLQRMGGNLRTPESPIPMFEHGVEIFAELARLGTSVEGARILEVGTGHRINMPVAFYLAGARSIISVDLFPILKRPLVMQMVADLAQRSERVKAIFAAYGADAVGERLERIAAAKSFDELAGCMGLDYRAPCDATNTGLPAKSVDLHFSYTVFEHIPREVLAPILREGSRLVTDDGLLCHHIDLSDHFSHADGSIGKINFLQYSHAEWAQIDNPRYGYQNRLRATDYRAIYEEASQELKAWLVKVDTEGVETIRNGFPLAAEFRGMDPVALSTVGVTAIS
jgi:hypothetical protein